MSKDALQASARRVAEAFRDREVLRLYIGQDAVIVKPGMIYVGAYELVARDNTGALYVHAAGMLSSNECRVLNAMCDVYGLPDRFTRLSGRDYTPGLRNGLRNGMCIAKLVIPLVLIGPLAALAVEMVARKRITTGVKTNAA